MDMFLLWVKPMIFSTDFAFPQRNLMAGLRRTDKKIKLIHNLIFFYKEAKNYNIFISSCFGSTINFHGLAVPVGIIYQCTEYSILLQLLF